MIESIDTDPVQTEAAAEPFTVDKGGITYTVSPLYEYELQGMVVTTHNAGSFLDISHGRWKDKLNIRDVCVIWGENARSGVYESMKFSSGDFTCRFRTRDLETFRAFNQAQMSNNHLLARDEAVARAIMSARRGDQVRLSGFLSEYAHDGGFHRGTSTTREDTGDGACETIYVTEFEILQPANRGWLFVFRGALGLAALCAILLVAGLFTGSARLD